MAMDQSFDMSSESGVDNGLQSDVVYRGFQDLPSDMLIKILSSIPVKERVRASRTCKAFYDALSGPHAFLDVKRLPGPGLSREQFNKILRSDVETKTQSAMGKRLCSSVTFINLAYFGHLLEPCVSSFDPLSFLSEFHKLCKLTELKIDNYFNVPSDVVFQVRPHKVQVSTLYLRLNINPEPEWSTSFLNELGCILDFGSVRTLELEDCNNTKCSDLRCLLEHDFKNLHKLDFDLRFSYCECRILSDLLMKNVECLKHVKLVVQNLRSDQASFLTALGRLQLKSLELMVRKKLINDRWLIDLTANSGDTLECLVFPPVSDDALDFIPPWQFKKLTHLELSCQTSQCLTSLIKFIEGRPPGFPRMRLKCSAARRGNETELQREQLTRLISSESSESKFSFMVQMNIL